MKNKIYQIDAFTDKLFCGNPAAVCPLEKWLPDETMQNIAAENNLAETAFYVPENGRYRIRWFTPVVEVDLCGHATLAAAHVIFNIDNYDKDILEFDSRSGLLSVKKQNDYLVLNFPSDKLIRIDTPIEIIAGLNYKPRETYKGISDVMIVFSSQNEIEKLKPDFTMLKRVDCRGIIATAPGNQVDFVSRFFAPQVGVYEDPVTGSAHTTLAPFWAERLGKNNLTAMQLSERKGWLKCKLIGDRVEIAGETRLYMTGQIETEG
ncbi:MAG: PhzF family phenazine biosynthesis protein [Bacteroidia bacterium]|nr:PhzF family phenazine biosynthesis protein [Bacteroidia bacterium]